MAERRFLAGISGVLLVLGVFLLVSCGSIIAQKVTAPVTYTERIDVPGASQAEIAAAAAAFFEQAFTAAGFTNSRVSEKTDAFVRGSFVADNIPRFNTEYRRYSSAFALETGGGYCQISFTDAVIQNTGYVSEQAREQNWQNHLATRNAVPSFGLKMPDNYADTEEEIRAEWEKENSYSPENPGPAIPAQYDYEAEEFNKQWVNLAAALKQAVSRLVRE